MKRIFAILCLFLLLTGLLSGCGTGKQKQTYRTLEDLKNSSRVEFANATNNICYAPQIVEDIPNVVFTQYTNYFDTFLEVSKGRKDAALSFSSIFVGLHEAYPTLECIVSEQTVPIVAFFAKRSEPLKQEFDSYVRSNPEVLRELKEKWVDGYGHNDYTIDFSTLENHNGMFTLSTCLDSPPMEYIKNGKPAGYELDLVYRFAEASGYAVNFVATEYTAAMTGAATGKYDIFMGFCGYTEERAEEILFSEPIYEEHLGYVVLGDGDNAHASLLEQFKTRFERNFLRESRWKLIANGLKVTVEITFFSVLFGSVLGFGLFLLGRKSQLVETLFFHINEFFESLPTLVILLIFFYVIFGDSALSGFVVATGVFTLLFTFTFFALLTGSVNGIPKGQTEGALALGYTPFQALSRVVLPQAMVSFLPGYKSAVVGILKSTAIVGYVAVQDLTSAGDRIRSLTFDALFPIFGITIIYFALARLLIWVMNRLLTVDLNKNRDRFMKEAAAWNEEGVTQE